MRHITTIALTVLLAMVAYSQRQLNKTVHELTDVSIGHESDLRYLQGMVRGQPRINKVPTHVTPKTQTPIYLTAPEDCHTAKTCALIPDRYPLRDF